MMYRVILYYNFSPVDNLKQFCADHAGACRDLGLKGRVLIAEEGINGTLAGATENIEQYQKYLRGLPGFDGTEFKEEDVPKIPFEKLIVRARPEIVALKYGRTINTQDGAEYLEPEEWRKVLESENDFVLLDVRNDYETKIGHFKGAVTPDVRYFWDFPKWLEKSGIRKEQKVLMYCTGGIRCEKFSAVMKQQGYKNIFQLHGGIINYAQKESGKHFKGKCFVFDDRMAVPVNPKDQEPVSRCEISGVPCDTYLNCANPLCNRLFLCSKEAAIQMEGCCSEACRNVVYRRPFNIRDIYTPFRKWYHYFKAKKRSEPEHFEVS